MCPDVVEGKESAKIGLDRRTNMHDVAQSLIQRHSFLQAPAPGKDVLLGSVGTKFREQMNTLLPRYYALSLALNQHICRLMHLPPDGLDVFFPTKTIEFTVYPSLA
ncbi:hypothetical protein EXIGLDRAFT_691708 [Exidia glandulosa HHB12029]|uniref:Uncharacterized protein n=1 Tax=Exidia glandulosa HHB12029 TaxID=1314781 RepID=A0A165P5G5_EXIGL|nr:hypothetical protein EXIGLDRAFT_691708 [Exidia glandulosa HHB12029]